MKKIKISIKILIKMKIKKKWKKDYEWLKSYKIDSSDR